MLSRRNDGFTLIELMVSAAAMGIVIFYALGTFTVQHQTYVVVDQVSETQQNSRAIAGMIERDLRNAGYLVPATAAVCGFDDTDGPDILVMSDTDAIKQVDQLPPTMQGNDLSVSTSTAPANGPTALSVDGLLMDDAASYKKDSGSASLDSDFRVNAGAIVIDLANPQRGVACGQVTAVGTNTITVDFDTTALNGANGTAPPDYRVVPGHYYEVNTATDPPQIERDGVILAKDVEDLQVAWFYDANQDGEATGNEYAGDDAANTYSTDVVDGNDLREVRFHVVVATRDDDPRNPDSIGTGQVRENRDPDTVSSDDGHRRRVYTSTVRIRNNAL
jgi:prepilin-type N-terminal cleavage/methylation domain-containing protein